MVRLTKSKAPILFCLQEANIRNRRRRRRRDEENNENNEKVKNILKTILLDHVVNLLMVEVGQTGSRPFPS